MKQLQGSETSSLELPSTATLHLHANRESNSPLLYGYSPASKNDSVTRCIHHVAAKTVDNLCVTDNFHQRCRVSRHSLIHLLLPLLPSALCFPVYLIRTSVPIRAASHSRSLGQPNLPATGFSNFGIVKCYVPTALPDPSRSIESTFHSLTYLSIGVGGPLGGDACK